MPKKKKGSETSREQVLENLISSTNKLLGDGTMGTLRGKFATKTTAVGAISTGSIGLDYILGVGGLPRGRVVEIYGPEAGGKTTLTLHVIAECQKAGGVAAFIDAEHALTPEYAQDVGVDLESLLINQPGCGEDAFTLTEHLIKSGAVDLIVIDSVSALVPRAELDAEMDKMQVGLQARLMSKAMRKLTAIIGATGTTVVFINQLRMKIGGYGNPETTSGGNALKYYSSMRMDVRKIGTLKKGDTVVGNRVKVKVVKNKLAPPFRTAEFDLVFGKGISWEGELIDYGVAAGVIEKKGAWYSKDGEQIGQGRDRVVAYLHEHKDSAELMKKQVAEYLNNGTNP
jgi:recombination protein RecA